jgi:hypothetical protein
VDISTLSQPTTLIIPARVSAVNPLKNATGSTSALGAASVDSVGPFWLAWGSVVSPAAVERQFASSAFLTTLRLLAGKFGFVEGWRGLSTMTVACVLAVVV